MRQSLPQFTGLLIDASRGDEAAFEKLMPLVYGELRQLARRYLRSERTGHTLQTTALVHEAYVKLVGHADVQWQGRAHFFRAAAQAMRRILVDHARNHRAAKRDFGQRVTLTEGARISADQAVDVVALDQALQTLSRLDPRKSSIVELRYFAGLTAESTAEVLGISLTTLKREWVLARLWLFASDPLVTGSVCYAQVPSPAYNDHSGRLRGVWVSRGNFNPGTGDGAIYKRLYSWRADQVAEIGTCLLGALIDRREQYSYDQLLRLTAAQRPAGNFNATGGAFDQRSYGYDSRGNRISETSDACSYAYTYGISSRPDLLTARGSTCSGSALSRSYQYDSDGRVAQIQSAADSSGLAANTLSFDYSPGGAATETVYKAVNVNGAVYGYYYDALGRRRAKSYPGGTTDEYFTDLGSQLLVDQGSNTLMTPVGFYTVDDYVWLAGRPIVLIRSKFGTDWSRLPDSSGDCTRNGESAACGIYFPVTDHIGKPVLMLDSSRKVAGAADYDPFGRVNRVTYNVDTPHPYANSSNLTIGDFRQALGGPGVAVKLRVLFDVVDTEQDHATLRDYAWLTDGDTSTSLTGPIGGYHRGAVWSPWVQPSAGRVAIKFASDATNCCPDATGGIDCACGQAPNFPYKGVTTESYEYQRYQTGSVPFWTPLRFPGQYFDSETDFSENWHRYYSAITGRYLQPEPMLANGPVYSTLMAHSGKGALPYAYALNNSLHYIDANGLFVATSVDYQGRALEAQLACNTGNQWACVEAAFYWFGDFLGLLGPRGAVAFAMGGTFNAPIDAAAQGMCSRVDTAATSIEKFLGPGATTVEGQTSDLILRSADGTKQIRFDLTDPHGLEPHINIETFRPRNLYPDDLRFIRMNNIHVYPKKP